MDIGFCTEDGGIYTTTDFARLPSGEFERKRRLLQCPECHGPAFFRTASFNRRAACFGARPHAQGCIQAATDNGRAAYSVADEHEALLMPGGKIIVDLRYGAPIPIGPIEMTGMASRPVRVHRNPGEPCLADAPLYRRLSSLLRTLIDVPAFSASDKLIGFDGQGEIHVRDFFVPLQSATAAYSGQFRGYWGLLSDAKLAVDSSLWFNSGGGNDNISFVLDRRFVDDFNQRYLTDSIEDLAGAYILVLGTPRVALNRKLYCEIADLRFLALRLT